IDDVRIVRMDNDFSDVLGIFQSPVSPGLPAVIRSIDAIPIGYAALVVVLASTYPNGVRIVRIQGNTTDRIGTFLIKERLPGGTCIHRFPYPTGGYGHIIFLSVFRVNGKIRDTP